MGEEREARETRVENANFPSRSALFDDENKHF
jgi:hypothetical protein